MELPHHFSLHQDFTTLPLRYSDLCHQLQHGV